MLFSLGLLSACRPENGLIGKDEAEAGFDTVGDPGHETAQDTAPPPPAEDCNGIDDDEDGLVDEGFPDVDRNGRADCQDTTCEALYLGAPGSITVREDCSGAETSEGGEVADPWNVRQQWVFVSSPDDTEATSSWAQPVIGNLTDDNGDGRVDEDDNPDVAVTMFSAGRAWVVVIDGATGIQLWSYRGVSDVATVVIADIDADGFPDVISTTRSGHAVALEGDGTLKWTAADRDDSATFYVVSVADLDEDGHPEVISDGLVLSGDDGSTEWVMPYERDECGGHMAAVGDIDHADGDQEVLFCGVAYDSDGTVLWDSGERGASSMWPVILQADSDPEAEVGWAGEHWSLWNADGSNLYTIDYPSERKQPGPPCAGDFDGDGLTEVGLPSYEDLLMFELDGSVSWTAPMDDSSGMAGCSGYDVNGDGSLEVLFAGESSFTIYDGATGATQYKTTDHFSATLFEYPSVADIDHDGHGEIVLTNSGGTYPAVVAYEHNGAGWPVAGSTWAVHDFAMTNTNDDGSVPQHPESSWETYNVYRARPAAAEFTAPDLAVSITDVCVIDCTYGPAELAIQAQNNGGSDVDAGVVVALYAIDDTGTRLIQRITLPAVPAGTRIPALDLSIPVDQIGPWGFVAAIDDDGAGIGVISECDEANNTGTWEEAFCL